MARTIPLSTHPFEFLGGRLCLDFTNTLEDRLEPVVQDRLTSYAELVSWGQQAHILTDEDAQHLLIEAAGSPIQASVVLERAVVLREALYRIFSAIAGGVSVEEADLRLFNVQLAEAMTHASIEPVVDRFTWGWREKQAALDCILWFVVYSAADVLTSEEHHNVRVCAADDCQWLFLDTSKNRSRRWCDMKSCGNRTKVRRHLRKVKKVSV